jgi:hypothetical protein
MGNRSLGERRQLHQVVLRYRLKWLTSFTPGRQPAFDHKGVEAPLP